MNFEIIPFPLLPANIRWSTGVYNNKEYGDTIFETVDDVDDSFEFDSMYGVVWSDGQYGVYDDYNDALWAVIEEDVEP